MNNLATLSRHDLIQNLRDPHWRIRNLYFILDKNGQKVLFTPNPVQEAFINEIWYRNTILKGRQLGFSTAVQLLWLDTCLFNPNIGSAVIAQDLDTAKDIRNTKIKFAYDNLPAIIQKMVPIVTDNVREIEWANGSFMIIATSARGRTLQRLHVTELGKIAAKYPDKAREIQTGSFPAVDQDGIIVVESTAEGISGLFYEMVKSAKEQQDSNRKLTKLDFKLIFATWWEADEYEIAPDGVIITEKDHQYFDRLETEIGRELSLRKRAWYVLKRKNDFGGNQEMMWQEYPSTIDEAFQQSSEGVYLAAQLTQVRKEGRICDLPYDPSLPVNTFWDLGVGDDIAIWFHQSVGPFDHFIDYLEGSGEPYNYYWHQMQMKGYVWGKHYLPHDGAHRRPGSEALKTSADMLGDLGVSDIEIVPRTQELIAAIQQLRMDMVHYRFDQTRCAAGILHLDNYQKDWNERLATWSSMPRKNGHQHAADAIRQKAQIAEMLRESGGTNRPNRRNRGGMAA